MTKSPAKNHFLKHPFSILFFCFLTLNLSGCSGGGGDGSNPTPSITTWAKIFGGVNEDVAHSVQQTSDGGYIVAGETSSSGAGSADFWILKLNSNGDIVWQKTYGGSNDDIARSIQQTSDGGYIVAGETSSSGAAFIDIWIIKLTPNGDIDWQKTFGGANDDVAYSIQQTSDGGYIVAGQSSSLGNPLGDIWILKLASNGDVFWDKTYGTGSSTANCIRQTLDGGYIAAGETYSSGTGSADFWVLKLDANGDLQPGWPKTYGGTYRDAANSIQQTSDGGYIVAGETSSSGANIPDFLILKLDSSGIVQWQKTYGESGYDIARSIQQTLDGGYIVAGETSSSGAGNADFWILKLNANGDIVWQKTYGGSNDDIARSIQQTLDGGFIVAGETSSSGAGYADFWILKIDENGNI